MKKSMKKIIPAFLMLGVAASMMATSSYAWFSMSREANVTGMQVQATADSSLVISQTRPVEAATSVNFKADAKKLAPATWVENIPSGEGNTVTTNYVTVSNTGDIDPNTGNAFGSGTLKYADAVEDKNFVDYIVYLASAGSELKGNLSATVTFIDSTTGKSDTLENEQLATTVDFYTKAVAKGDAVVTNPNSDDISARPETSTFNAAHNIETNVIKSGVTIPVNTTEGCLAVIMRVYIDGALPVNDVVGGPCYVKSSTVDLAAVKINVDFTFTVTNS